MWPVIVHSGRTAVASVASLLVARLFRLPEAYWAPITTLVITQSSLGAALAVSWQRFVGTIVGAVIGAVLASYFGPHWLVFGTSVFVLGLVLGPLRVVTHSDLTSSAAGSRLADRLPSVRRSVYRNCGSADVVDGMAGEGSD